MKIPSFRTDLRFQNGAPGDKIDPVEARKMERWIRSSLFVSVLLACFSSMEDGLGRRKFQMLLDSGAKYEAKKYAQPGVDPPHVRLARGGSG